jgi:hypothetical protein
MSRLHSALVISLGVFALLSGCSKQAAPPPAATQATDTADLAARETAVASREAELAAREAALAAKSEPEAPKVVPAPVAAPEPRAAPAAVVRKPKPAPVRTVTHSKVVPKTVDAPSAPPPPAPRMVTVPSGTPLQLSLTGELSTKTAKVGDTIRARVANDVLVDGRVAIAAGTIVAGQVTHVISGSEKIGGVPTLGLRFDRLELPGGKDVPIAGEVAQKGRSDTARDTAKIVGGAAAGALLGHAVKSNSKGTIIGGLLGGAVGAVAAQKTGTDVQLSEGTALSIALTAPVEVTVR